MVDVKITDLRRKYTRSGLVDENLPENPMKLFNQWFKEALHSEVIEPNAMALATVSGAGSPNVRMVLLKGIDDNSINFYTNYNSRKGQDLAANPFCSCTFWWAELERQVRLSGTVEKLPESVSENYFQSRPRESQIGAWASDQSKPVADREELERKFSEIESRFKDQEIPKPIGWGGFKITVQEMEFWQGRPGRLHDRIYYIHSSGKWNRQRLAP
ncbi:MAG: pyridoxamine 5'-phosphate oxidase [Balneolaceae bacterium]|nr:MAG: pyridoxamine 5'-phosphate oxidase [Balneolaceae bacterium]